MAAPEIAQDYVLYKRDEDGAYQAPDGESPSLAPHPQNPNKGDVKNIRESIDRNGWYGVVTVQKSTGYILAGNHRFFAAAGKKAAEIPATVVDVDDATAIRILLADNQVARRAIIDEAKVRELLDGMRSIKGTGYDPVDAALDAVEEQEEAGDPEGEHEGDEGADVPDDAYTPTYGVMVVCTSEDDQRFVYEAIKGHSIVDPHQDREIRVVAV